VDKSFRELAHILQLIADIVFLMTVSCQMSQVNHEIDYQLKQGGGQLKPVQAYPVGDGYVPPKA
jgi:hypothetical protein